MRVDRKKRYPEWLKPIWEQKKLETASRVEAAINNIKNQGDRVTLKKICETVKLLYGFSISPNTIKRNNIAYEVYRRNQNRLGGTKRDSALMQLYSNIPEDEKSKLHSKISRLRRSAKDSLIAKIILLEQAQRWHEEVENTLREEIIQLNLRLLETK